jgi:tetratricopeptide (TPR) repeat protein
MVGGRWVNFLKTARKHVRSGLAVLLLLIVLGVSGYYACLELQGRHHLGAARQALAQRKFPPAWEHLSQCLKVWPDRAEIHFLAARTARRGGAYHLALHHLNRCQQLQEPNEATALEWALLRAQQGDLADIEYDLQRRAEAHDADAVLVLEALAQGYKDTFRQDLALQALERWLAREPDNIQALLWRAAIWEQLRRFSQALEDYRQAFELDPEHDPTRLRLAELLLDMKRRPEALEHFQSLRQRQPDDPSVLSGLARCLRELGRSEEAEQILDHLLVADPGDVRILTERAKLALEVGPGPAAESWLRQAVLLAPHDYEAAYTLGRCLHQLGQEKEAKTYFSRAAQIEADETRLRQLLRQIEKSPSDPELRVEAGILCLRRGSEPEGERWLASALRLDPDHRAAHLALVNHYQRIGKYELAERHRRALLK